MLFFAWDERLLTGVPIIDEQHQELVRIINQLASQLAEGLEWDRFSLVFKRLIDYARMHFATEEDLMQRNGIPSALSAAHYEAHGRFVEEILLMKEEAARDPQRAGDALVRYLIGWLTFHILGADQQLGAQLQAAQRGEDPTLVGAPFQRDERTSLLVDALDGLGQVLISKNRALQQCRVENGMLRAQIERQNAEFEERVRARTDELLQVNQALERDCQELKQLLSRLDAAA